MTTRETLALGLAVSLGLHAIAAEVLAHAPKAGPHAPEIIEFDVKPKTPPPPVAATPPPPEPPKPEPKPVKLAKRPKPAPDLAPPKPDEPPKPPPEKVVPRVFGAHLSGETSADGVSVPEGNTLNADPNRPRPKEIPQAPPSTGAPAPPGPPAFIPVDESELASFPEVADEVKAPYPTEAEAQQIEGTVAVRVEINTDGSVHGARVLKGLGHGLDEAAVKALKRFKFKPARDRGGRAVPAVIVWKYTFRLDR